MVRESSRRRLLRAVVAGAAAGLAGCQVFRSPSSGTDTRTRATSSPAAGTGTGTADGSRSVPDSIGLETVASGLQAPVDVAFAPGAERRYVVDQPGVVRVHGAGGLRDEPFLDLRDAVEFGGEKGLLGLALHPEFAKNRRLFVRYSAPPRGGTPDGYSHTFVLSEFRATDGGRRARPDSERALLEIPEPQSNHNAGSVAFGPDGLLYVGVGDGGGGGDQGRGHVDDWYDAVDGGNGQDVTENRLGSLLRINVDTREDGRPYGVPDDNPLVGRPGLDTHYAWGFRNPWRISFDGDRLFVADVGQNNYEEVNLVEKGGNYGWNVEEGTHCYDADKCPDNTPQSVRGGKILRDPVIEYPHSGGVVSGISVIGGYVYRGSAMPALEGRYVFGDLGANGRLFVASESDGEGLWPTGVLPVAESDAGKLQRLYSFGRDPAGELYVLGQGSDGSGVHRLVPAG